MKVAADVMRIPALSTLAGLACAVVPFAIIIHLVSEALALGSASETPNFFLRHAYLLVPLLFTAWSFSKTVGLGCARREVIRRCAIARSQLRTFGAWQNAVTFAAANLGFFCLTQLVEGVPIAAGSLFVGLAAAVVGSIVSAAVLFVFGRAIVGAALALVTRSRLPRRGMRARRIAFVVTTRCASNLFTLLAPNRPPPFLSFA
jgi:hypothetical protein